MQRPSSLRRARHAQLCAEYARYGLHILVEPIRVAVSARLMADGLPAWRSRLMQANERSAEYHAR